MSEFVFYIFLLLLFLVPWFLRQSAKLPGVNMRFYPAYGLALLILFSAAEFWGWGYLNSDKVKNVPTSVRQNPGVYRSHYNSYGRTYGGK